MATTITGANQQTDWFDLTALAESNCLNLVGDFSDAVGVRYSNNHAQAKGTDYTTDTTTYSTKAGPLRLPFGIADYVAFFSGNSWSAGKVCKPQFARGKDPNGQLFTIITQSGGGLAGVG